MDVRVRLAASSYQNRLAVFFKWEVDMAKGPAPALHSSASSGAFSCRCVGPPHSGLCKYLANLYVGVDVAPKGCAPGVLFCPLESQIKATIPVNDALNIRGQAGV